MGILTLAVRRRGWWTASSLPGRESMSRADRSSGSVRGGDASLTGDRLGIAKLESVGTDAGGVGNFPPSIQILLVIISRIAPLPARSLSLVVLLSAPAEMRHGS